MKFKRIVSTTLCAVMLCTALSGCKKENTVSEQVLKDAEVLTENTLPIADGDVTLSIWLENRSQGYLKSYEEAKALQILQEKTGIKLEFIHPTGAAKEQLNIMLASGDLPDLIFYNWTKFKKEVNSGIFLNLEDYIQKWAPNFRALLEENPGYKKEYYSVYGEGVAPVFPLIADDDRFLCYDGYFIRQDWLDKVGLPMPETIEDWETVLRAFKEKDPNGNGKQDEIGFSTYGYMTNYLFMPAFGMASYGYYIDPETGKITHAALQPQLKEYFKTMNRWYEDGLVNPEYLTTSGKELDSLILNNELGALHCDNNNSMPKYMTGNPDMNLVAAPFPKSPDGKQYTSQTSAIQRVRLYGTFITSSCKNVEAAVRLLDYLYTDEGAALMNWGVEGETYTVNEDGSKQFTDLIMHNPEGKNPYEAIAAYMPNTGFTGFNCYEAAHALEGNFDDRLKAVKEDSVNYTLNADKSMLISYVPTTIEEENELATFSEDLSTYLSEMYSKFIMGVEPLDNFEEFQENVKQLGIEKGIKITQQAYDRMGATK